MAGFVFETGTETQAENFKTGDTLVFQSDAPTDISATYNAASGLSAATITLSDVSGHSLTFAASALSGAGTEFLAADGSLQFGAGAATTATVDNAHASAFIGITEVDTLTVGGAGDHVIHGSSADGNMITVQAGAGADPSSGNYVISGGAGSDTINLTNASGNLHVYGNALGAMQGSTDGSDTITLGTGNSYVNGNGGNDVITDTHSGSNRIYGGGGDDQITAGNGDNHINGNMGNDIIHVGSGNNTVFGGQGDDTLYGGSGNNVLSGDAGNDIIHAGTGLNVMTGGSGNDMFDFSTGHSTGVSIGSGSSAATFYNEVTDFTNGTDQMHLGNATDAVLYDHSGSTFGTVGAAEAYAQSLLNTSADDHAVAAIAVGGDTYLFYNNAGTGTTIDSIIKVDGFTDTSHLTATGAHASFV